MKLIKISDTQCVMADAIDSIRIITFADVIEVKTKIGEKYGVKADYGKSLYATFDRIVTEVNEALQCK